MDTGKEKKRKLKNTLARHYRHYNEHNHEVVSIFECVSSVLREKNFLGTVQVLYEYCKNIIGAKHGYVALLNGENSSEIIYADKDGVKKILEPALPVPVTGLREVACTTGKIVYDNSFLSSQHARTLPQGLVAPENVMIIPILHNEKAAGIIGLADKAGGFTHHDLKVGRLFGEFASVAIHTKKTMDALVQKEIEHLHFLGSSPDAILIYAAEKIVYANQAAAQIMGMDERDDFIGKKLIEFEMFAQVDDINGRVYAALKGEKDFIKIELPDRSGLIRHIECYLSFYLFEGKDAVIIVVRDVTERRRMEEEARKATKLEAISILAGGIAHDFNNLLTIILGNLSIAKMYAGNLPDVHRKLREIEGAALQTKDLTSQLLVLAKGNPLVKHVTSVRDLLTELVRFALHGSNVVPVFTFEDNLPPIHVDTAQFGQVINNLVINAVQAMYSQGGTFEVKVACENIKQTSPFLYAGNYIKISVKDQGCGIPQDAMAHIFEPFFTTKEQGSGLGLATSYNIIKQHNGHITVESEVGVGTVFHIYLPVADNIEETEHKENRVIHGQGRILLMDDEYGIRKTAGEMLRILGYNVDFAVNGEEALQRYLREKQRGATYDAVILDMTVRGGMGGQKTMEKLLQADPHVKAIISSGYTNAPLLTDYQKHGFLGFVFKPYRLEEISEVLHNIIDSSST